MEINAVGDKGVAGAVCGKDGGVPPCCRWFYAACKADCRLQSGHTKGKNGIQYRLCTGRRTRCYDPVGKISANRIDCCDQIFCSPANGFTLVRNADVAVESFSDLPQPVVDAHHGNASFCEGPAVGTTRGSVAATGKKAPSMQEHHAPSGMDICMGHVEVVAQRIRAVCTDKPTG